jgi:hypothetical protein
LKAIQKQIKLLENTKSFFLYKTHKEYKMKLKENRNKILLSFVFNLLSTFMPSIEELESSIDIVDLVKRYTNLKKA